ncbi:MAG: Gfo/Idh/MocA family protein [Candidatus Sumerlaeia bacterium]
MIKTGIVGTGSVADYGHLPAIRKAGGEVLACADINHEKAREWAARHDIPDAFASHTELIQNPEIQLVAICTLSDSHERIAIDALRAGKHVYIEKPATESAAQIAHVAQVAKDTGKFAYAGSHHPYRANVQHLRKRIASGEMGDIYLIEARKRRGNGVPKDQAGITHRRCGVSSGSSSHRIELALYLMGMPNAKYVSARTCNYFIKRKATAEDRAISGLVDDSLLCQIIFDNGCTLMLRDIADSHFPKGQEPHYLFGEFSVYGTGAAARLHPLTYYHREVNSDEVTEESPDVDNSLDTNHGPAYRYLFDCIARNEKPEDAPERAIAVMEILDAIYESADAGGRQIRL